MKLSRVRFGGRHAVIANLLQPSRTHSFRRCWRVACAQKFRCFSYSRDRSSGDAVVFPGIGDDGFFDHKG